MKYNKAEIMKKAHVLYRDGRYGTFTNALKIAWRDAKAVADIRAEYGDVKTWYGWTLVGREVWHGEKAVAQTTVAEAKNKKGTQVLSFFTYEQTCEIGEQPYKVA